MARFQFQAAALTVILSAWTWQAVQAQQPSGIPYAPPAPFPEIGRGAQPIPSAHTYGLGRLAPRPAHTNAQPVLYADGNQQAVPGQAAVQPDVENRAVPGYVYLNAPMYSSPRQDVPYQVGGAVITNQALAPHEMLYPHRYKAMYPPYYYQVRGHWKVTPFGVWQCEDWKLRGTVVKVNYKSRIGLSSGFVPPVVR